MKQVGLTECSRVISFITKVKYTVLLTTVRGSIIHSSICLFGSYFTSMSVSNFVASNEKSLVNGEIEGSVHGLMKLLSKRRV